MDASKFYGSDFKLTIMQKVLYISFLELHAIKILLTGDCRWHK